MNIKEKQNNNIKIKVYKNKNDEKMDVTYPLPNTNSCVLFVGPPSSGKTNLMINLLDYYHGIFDYIYFFSPSINTLPKSFINKLCDDRIYDNIRELGGIIDELMKTNDKKTLFIFDDMMKYMKDNKTMIDLVQNRRHISGGATIWILTQKLRSVDLQIRTGISHIIFFKMSYLIKTETDALYDGFISGINKNEFNNLLSYVFNNEVKHTFLYIDVTNNKYYKNFNELSFS
jgi:hypothetical protein